MEAQVQDECHKITSPLRSPSPNVPNKSHFSFNLAKQKQWFLPSTNATNVSPLYAIVCNANSNPLHFLTNTPLLRQVSLLYMLSTVLIPWSEFCLLNNTISKALLPSPRCVLTTIWSRLIANNNLPLIIIGTPKQTWLQSVFPTCNFNQL